MKRALFTLALVVAWPSVARAQPSHDPLAAEALFNEARELMKKDDFAHACPKFEASERLDPGIGTLLNLGDCLEKAGKTASAWLRFREAASAALSAGQDSREGIARERAAALEPKLCKLLLRVPATAELTIERDGAIVDPAAWGLAVPLDPGVHTLRASAPGKIAWSTELVITPSMDGSGGERVAVIPPLDDAPVVTVVPPPVKVDVAPQPLPAMPGKYKAVALIAAGVGVAGLGIGTWLAVDAKQTYDDAKSRCGATGCNDESRALGRTAGKKADAASVAFAIGAAGLTASVVTWLIAPRANAKTVGIAVVPTGPDFRGAMILLEGTRF